MLDSIGYGVIVGFLVGLFLIIVLFRHPKRKPPNIPAQSEFTLAIKYNESGKVTEVYYKVENPDEENRRPVEFLEALAMVIEGKASRYLTKDELSK